jgi:hypothetical protein
MCRFDMNNQGEGEGEANEGQQQQQQPEGEFVPSYPLLPSPPLPSIPSFVPSFAHQQPIPEQQQLPSSEVLHFQPLPARSGAPEYMQPRGPREDKFMIPTENVTILIDEQNRRLCFILDGSVAATIPNIGQIPGGPNDIVVSWGVNFTEKGASQLIHILQQYLAYMRTLPV